ncbi:MAG TPA: metalloregulator ArsR/SmtB family transcription factor [Thermaerobacter sp.]
MTNMPRSTSTSAAAVTAQEAEQRQLEIRAKFFDGLANPTRLRIVELLLQHGELNVGQIVEALGVSQSQVSNQLACLKWCGYVTSRSEGRFVYYRVTDPRIRALVELSRQIVADNAEHIRACTRLGGTRE